MHRILTLLILASIILSGCDELSENMSDTTTNPTDNVANSWDMLADGLEYEQFVGENTVLRAVRIDPEQYNFRVHYQAGNPLTIDEWRDFLPDAEVIVNANFFTEENTVVGMLIVDSVQYGSSYVNRGGTFFVNNDTVGLTSNITYPYQGQAYSQAVQAFPMLVTGGQSTYSNTNDTFPSRRTVIALDSSGQVIILVTPGFGIGLYNLSQYLPTLDIDIANALNLDGGGSTMMYIRSNDSEVTSFDPVPAVLAIYRR